MISWWWLVVELMLIVAVRQRVVSFREMCSLLNRRRQAVRPERWWLP